MTPVTHTTEEHPWQNTQGKDESDGGWMPSDFMPKSQSRTGEIDVKWQSQAVEPSRGIVARAQVSDQDPQQDQVITFIQSLLRGRADGVEVRWTGSRRLTVCFETPTSRDASLLVREISARQELAALQIDFCVLVK